LGVPLTLVRDDFWNYHDYHDVLLESQT
jgi:hypothetical protein